MLTRLRDRAWRRVRATVPWTNAYGLARTLLALSTLATLLFSSTRTLFRPALGVPVVRVCADVSRFSLYCLVPEDRLGWARWLAIVVLAVAASGWRPRWTGVLHWYVAFSLLASSVMVDGGDQVNAVLTLLLVPVTLTDPRRWHWQAWPHRAPVTPREPYVRLVAFSALAMCRLQVAVIYFHAAVAKLRVTEWEDGTAVYYWFTDPAFGMPGWMRPVMMPLLTGPFVTVITWGALLLEFMLFTGLVMDRRHRRTLLVLGILFHGGIGLIHGLISFMLSMWAALLLYLYPVDRALTLPLRLRRRRPATEDVARRPAGAAPALAAKAA